MRLPASRRFAAAALFQERLSSNIMKRSDLTKKNTTIKHEKLKFCLCTFCKITSIINALNFNALHLVFSMIFTMCDALDQNSKEREKQSY